MKPATALLCLNGDVKSVLPYIELADYDRIIAVDGGVNALVEAGLRPETIIGDLDSAEPEKVNDAQREGTEVIQLDEQESTDFEKALRYAITQGFAAVDVIGYRGSRFDHELATLAVAGRFADQIEIRLLDNEAVGSILTGPAEKELNGLKGMTCSILAVYPCTGLELTGFEWPKAQVHVEGMPFSLSNVIHADHASIQVQSGTLLVYLHGRASDTLQD